MRTTVELPPELLRAAKARAAESGESLKALLTRAVSAELHTAADLPRRRSRVQLPLFGSKGPRVSLTNADLEQALAETDLSQHTRRVRPPKRRRAS